MKILAQLFLCIHSNDFHALFNNTQILLLKFALLIKNRMERNLLIVAILLITLSSCHTHKASSTDGYTLVWSEEFNTDGPVDPQKWNFEIGLQRNHEAQYYQPDNAVCKNGCLQIEGRIERKANPAYDPNSNAWNKRMPYADYTSSSINTRHKFTFQYGRLEVRAKIPTASGSWPAIWLLGSTMPWPHCVEIDVMEYYQIKGTPHILANAAWGGRYEFDAQWDTGAVPFTHFLAKDADWANKFHVWRIDWDENAIRLYLDDELLNETLLDQVNNLNPHFSHKHPFRQPHYILLNLALGGDNGGKIDNSAFPIVYEVDYVRVYQKQ